MDENGYLTTSSIFIVDDVLYSADATGIVTEEGAVADGWYDVDGNKYYCKDGDIVKDQMLDIGDARYYFGWDGSMETDSFWLYDETTDTEHRYLAGDDGKLISGWYDENGYGDIRYYDPVEYYMHVDAFITDDGNMYYVDENGWLVTGRTFAYGDALYTADENGIVTAIDVSANGWIEIDDNWYYYQDGAFIRDQLVELGGAYYHFESDGIMSTGCFSYWDEDAEEWVTMLAQENGVVLMNQSGWYQTDDGWYYFKSPGVIACDEFCTVAGVDYFFDWDGLMVTGSFEYYDYESDEWIRCLATKDGAVINSRTGWYKLDNNWYYFKSAGKLASYEFLTIAGIDYYFNWKGIMATGCFDYYNAEYGEDVTGLATTNGAVINERTGWYKLDNDWYYFKAPGVLTINEIISDGGLRYYLNWDGVMAMGQFYYNGDYYMANSAGVMLKNTWVEYQNEWYYASDDYTLYEEDIYTIGGKQYVFSSYGTMYTGLAECNGNYYITYPDGANEGVIWAEPGWKQIDLYWYYTDATGKCYTDRWLEYTYYFGYNGSMTVGTAEIDGIYYHFNGDGICTDKVGSGWDFVNGEWYYNAAGEEPYTGWVDDTYYIYEGKMRYSSYVYDENTDKSYFVDYDGKKVKNGWYRMPADYWCEWIYANADGTLAASEWKKDGAGDWYYFDEYSDLVYGVVEIDGVVQCFDENGKWIIPQNGVYYTGWQKANGSWYYFYSDGTLLQDKDTAVINGVTYEFYWDGELVSDTVSWEDDRVIYYDSDGRRTALTPGWHYVCDDWYYIEADGSPAEGLRYIGGSYYYFSGSGRMYTGSCWVDEWDGYYFFNDSGAYQAVGTGWYYADGEWYYFVNGKPLNEGVHWIGGNYYYLSSNGLMNTYDYYYMDFVFGSEGLVRNAWYYDGSCWYYADAYGRAVRGEQVINGVKYWFTASGVWVR